MVSSSFPTFPIHAHPEMGQSITWELPFLCLCMPRAEREEWKSEEGSVPSVNLRHKLVTPGMRAALPVWNIGMWAQPLGRECLRFSACPGLAWWLFSAKKKRT